MSLLKKDKKKRFSKTLNVEEIYDFSKLHKEEELKEEEIKEEPIKVTQTPKCLYPSFFKPFKPDYALSVIFTISIMLCTIPIYLLIMAIYEMVRSNYKPIISISITWIVIFITVIITSLLYDYCSYNKRMSIYNTQCNPDTEDDQLCS